MPTIILRLSAVKQRTGLSRSTIDVRISHGEFPRAVSLGCTKSESSHFNLQEQTYNNMGNMSGGVWSARQIPCQWE